MVASNIQGARSLAPPTITTSGKQDGGGNGDGGMYFGQDPGGQQPQNYFGNYNPFQQADTEDMVYTQPPADPSKIEDELKHWKAALANKLYAGFHHLMAGYQQAEPPR